MPLTDLDSAATYKILVLGDTTVGKSSLLRCLTGQEFQGKIRRTIGLYALLLSNMGRSPNYGRNSNILIPDPYH